eukprot:TRINITY_DN7281_c0_g1_i1.p1 TRINITY_DN7281_c0_g1~~TRINITY_DN7281_c0_g1_i1.p1  ORF type:complete len:151 (+),score=57.13 TRINITY_DN7281_c0_g1_i1:455-907(+)
MREEKAKALEIAKLTGTMDLAILHVPITPKQQEIAKAIQKKKDKSKKRNIELKEKKKMKNEIDEDDLATYEQVEFGEQADRPPELRVVPKKKQVLSWATPVPVEEVEEVAPVAKKEGETYTSEYQAIADKIRRQKREAKKARRAAREAGI